MRHLTLLLAVLGTSPARADHDLQSWSLLTAWGKTGDLRWYAEVQPRVSASQGRFERLLLRPALGWQLDPNVSVWVGGGWTPSTNPTFRDEARAFEQVLLEHQFGAVSLVNRFRLEQRFIADTDGVSLRVRHMLRGVHRWGRHWGLAVYEELFFNLNSVAKGPLAGFDQNRFFAGVNYRFDARWQLEGGYLHNLVARPAPLDARHNHIALLMVVFTAP